MPNGTLEDKPSQPLHEQKNYTLWATTAALWWRSYLHEVVAGAFS